MEVLSVSVEDNSKKAHLNVVNVVFDSKICVSFWAKFDFKWDFLGYK